MNATKYEPSDRVGQRSVRRLTLISAARRCETEQRREQRQNADAPRSSDGTLSVANLLGVALCVVIVGYLLLWAWGV